MRVMIISTFEIYYSLCSFIKHLLTMYALATAFVTIVSTTDTVLVFTECTVKREKQSQQVLSKQAITVCCLCGRSPLNGLRAPVHQYSCSYIIPSPFIWVGCIDLSESREWERRREERKGEEECYF